MMINLDPPAQETSQSLGQVARPPLAVYVHFPWCLKKCPYCDFVSFEKDPPTIEHERYAAAVRQEILFRQATFENYELISVFFGGGTPSLWAPEALGSVLRALLAAAPHRADDVEVTVECNPSSLDREHASALADRGVNRLSVGVQSLDARRLRFLGRWHDPDEALRALEAAVDAVPRVSGDLIYGVAAQDPAHAQRPEEAAADVARVADTGVEHVSAYALTIEEETRFGTLKRQGRLPLLGDDVVAETFLAVRETLEGRGMTHYEVSNYALTGQESRHNAAYWRGHDYLGLGCAAFGTLSDEDGVGLRYRNPLTPRRYFAAAEAGTFAPSFEEPLTPETRLLERLMLGLRMREGVDLHRAARELKLQPLFEADRQRTVHTLIEAGKLELHEGRLRIPPDMWLHADGIVADLF